MELREIESETKEQAEKSSDMAVEIADHQEKARHLEATVGALKEAQAQVDSEGLRSALQEAEAAKQSTGERLQELREQREDLLAQNERMQAQCREAFERKRKALEKLPFLQQAGPGHSREANAASEFYDRMEAALEGDLNRTAQGSRDLEEVRSRLEKLEL